MKSARVYLFCSKSNTVGFEVAADPTGKLPVDQAAGLLAMHCLVRGDSPSDYRIMVNAPLNTAGLTKKAEKLLKTGQGIKRDIKLSRRENEVLPRVRRSLTNKEIANELNITERTIKFHVSSLLSKFNVHSRMELVRATAARGSN